MTRTIVRATRSTKEPREWGALVLAAAGVNDVPTLTQAVAAGADLNTRDPHGRTPLVIGVEAGHGGVVEFLLDHGADPLAHAPKVILRAYEKLGSGADKGPRGRGTLLHQAAGFPRGGAVVPRLLARGFDLEAVNQDGSTPLHLAVAHALPGEPVPHGSALEALLGRGARVEARDRHARTPLFHASHAWVIRRLLDAGADPAGADLRFKRGAELRLLLGAGADPRAQPAALRLAAGAGDVDAVKALLEHGSDPRGDAHPAFSPLAEASRAGHQEVVELLVAAGAETRAEPP